MASARQPPPLHIFQDPVTPFDHAEMPQLPSALPSPSSPSPSAHGRRIHFDPPASAPIAPSPQKTFLQSSFSFQPLLGRRLNAVSLPRPSAPLFITDSPPKKPVVSTFDTSKTGRPQKALFTTFSSSFSADKENLRHAVHNADTAKFADRAPGPRPSLKRPLLEPAPIREAQPKRPKLEVPAVVSIPQPADMPTVEDDGNKPPYSYAMLIGMSILRAPNRRLTLAQIYKWICDNFAYYRTAETGWQNSIRHNLSLSRAFVKRERPKDDPGKGNYWAIEPGMEGQFLKDKNGRRSTTLSLTTPLPQPVTDAVQTPSVAHAPIADATHLRPIVPRGHVEPAAPDDAAAASEPSSDATIPASDAALVEDERTAGVRNQPGSAADMRSSPPPIGSSPPMARRRRARGPTPPPMSRFALGSSGPRKRKAGSMNDSGYYSSIDSSAVRPNASAVLLTSEANANLAAARPSCAEDEIARLRQTSYDHSPSKIRAIIKQPPSNPNSSSPLRHFDRSFLVAPTTPGPVFKLPALPPGSVSPNTNLRNHRNRIRELVGSPVRPLTAAQEEQLWSPAFKIPTESYPLEEDHSIDHADLLDIFRDDPLPDPAKPSPERRPSKRPRFDRASTTAGVLADITGNSNTFSLSTTPNFNIPYLHSPAPSSSPSKSPTKLAQSRFVRDELPHDDFLADDARVELDEVDILRGFERIGGGHVREDDAGGYGRRPGLGRSWTSRF